jgi:hypothetical protein
MNRMPVELRLADHTTDELCELVEQGLSKAKIAAKWGCTRRQIQLWIEGNPVRAERDLLARQVAAEAATDKAEKVLLDIPVNGTVAQVAQARELSFYYRWLASKLNPAAYGDKLAITHKVEVNPDMMTDAQLAAIAAGGTVIDGEAEDVTDGQEPAPVHRDMHTRNQALA